MIKFLDALELQLRNAKRPRRRPAGRAILAGTFVLLAIGGPAAAATGLWRPVVGDERRGTPAVVAGEVPEDQAGAIGVLRRPQSQEDRGFAAQNALRYFDDNEDGIRTSGVRVVKASSLTAVLVPVARFNLLTSQHIPPDASPRVKAVMAEKRDGICLFAPDPSGDGGGQSCWTTDEVVRGVLPGSIGKTLYGLVPDGVAAIEAVLEDGQHITATVRNNFYAAPIASTKPGGRGSAAMQATWRDPAGRIVKELHAVVPASTAGQRLP